MDLIEGGRNNSRKQIQKLTNCMLLVTYRKSKVMRAPDISTTEFYPNEAISNL